MIFQRSALLAALLAIGGAAFAPQRSTVRSTNLVGTSVPVGDGGIIISSRLKMALDEYEDDDEYDDDDYDDNEDPLSDGVDSVSWLPTEIGANGPTKAMGEVGADADTRPVPARLRAPA